MAPESLICHDVLRRHANSNIDSFGMSKFKNIFKSRELHIKQKDHIKKTMLAAEGSIRKIAIMELIVTEMSLL